MPPTMFVLLTVSGLHCIKSVESLATKMETLPRNNQNTGLALKFVCIFQISFAITAVKEQVKEQARRSMTGFMRITVNIQTTCLFQPRQNQSSH
jgi:hypothetical protein